MYIPFDILCIIVSKVNDDDKGSLRLVCRLCRDAVHNNTTKLVWRGIHYIYPIPIRFPMQTDGYTMLRTLKCNETHITDIGPLAACTRLKFAEMCQTDITDLGPLASCTRLMALNCSLTGVSSLDPLAHCKRLINLICTNTNITDLGPLANCTRLKFLRCA